MKSPEGPAEVIFEFRGYRLEPRQRRLRAPDGRRIRLRDRVFDTLCVLVRRAGEPVSKAELMEAVWPGAVVEENNLNQAISTLRRTFGDDRQNPAFIATITGQGYQFVADVRRLAAEETPAQAASAQRAPTPWRHGLPVWQLGLAVAAVAVVGLGLYGLIDRAVHAPAISLDDARLVTPFPGSHRAPTLSPDGTLMAFVSDRSGTDQIWVQGLPDGTPVQITDGSVPATAPSWSPVENAILFQRVTSEGSDGVWLTDAMGSVAPRLVMTDARRPRFAPDGRSYVFTRGLKEVHVATLGEHGSRPLEGAPATRGFAEPMPAMNAAGDIAFVLAEESPSGNLWVYRAEDGSFHQLTRSRADFPGIRARAPVWLPDGRSIVHAAAPEDPANHHLWLTDSQTGRMTRISTGVGDYGEPAVSRDGSRIAYSHTRPVWRLVATDPRTGEERIIHESRSMLVLPSVSPDGKSVVWFGADVYTVSVEGGDPVRRTFGSPGAATLPAWSRDGTAIYYYQDGSLHRIELETGHDERVLEDFHWSSKNWLAVHGDKLAYQQRGFLPRSGHLVIRDLASGSVRDLDEEVLATDWSRDGTTLLARRKGDSAIVTCAAPAFRCEPVLDGGEPVGGAIPRWSADESQIYFRRARQDKPGYAEIWAIPREGGEARAMIEVGPYARAEMLFGVTADDEIVWPEYDTQGISEIWMVDLAEPPAQGGSD